MKRRVWLVGAGLLFVIALVGVSCQLAPTQPSDEEPVNTPAFTADGITLTPHDHTLIIKAIGDNLLGPYGVLANLDTTDSITGTAVLQAALKVEAIPDSVKEKIKFVLKYAPAIEEAMNNLDLLPQNIRSELDEIKAKIEEARSPEELRQILVDLKKSGKYNNIKGMDKAFDFAMASKWCIDQRQCKKE